MADRPSRGGVGVDTTRSRSLVDAAAVTLQFNCQRRVFTVYLINGGLLMAAALGVSVDVGAPLPPQQH